jgi:PucR C-terminal helix-turn-helix domain
MPATHGHTNEEILEAFIRNDRVTARTARAIGINERSLHARLKRIEEATGTMVRSAAPKDENGNVIHVNITRDTRPNPISLGNGVVVVGSDAHYWPGQDASTGHRGMLKVIELIKPDVVIMNGDEFDGAKISRHAPIGWEDQPDVFAELRECQAKMGEIADAARRAKPGVHLLGTFGNHTYRLDNFLASHVAQLRGVFGTKFEDHFPDWTYRWAWMANEHTLIKHRIRGGVHAAWNNTAAAHITTVTGHTHQLQVTPRSTMSPVNRGTIYGVDTGMLADPWGPQFTYCEQGPRNWRAGFAVLTFNTGVLMPPELCQVVGEDVIFFRGNTIFV